MVSLHASRAGSSGLLCAIARSGWRRLRLSLSEKLAGFGQLHLQRMQQAGFRRRGALFSQFLDRFRIDLLRFVDQLFAGLRVALYELVQEPMENISWLKPVPFG